MKYRLYIDESGNPDLGHVDDSRYRFLGLSGIIMDLEYVAQVAAPDLEQMKKTFFPYHPDEPVIFHRKEILNALPPFDALSIAGLQIADLIAHPSQRYALLQHRKIEDDREVFGGKIAEILVRSKYYRSRAGIIEGYGIKVLP